MEFIDSFLGKVGWDEEVSVGDEEVWVRLFDVALERLSESGRDFAEVSVLVDHLGVECLESALVLCHCEVIGSDYNCAFTHFKI